MAPADADRDLSPISDHRDECEQSTLHSPREYDGSKGRGGLVGCIHLDQICADASEPSSFRAPFEPKLSLAAKVLLALVVTAAAVCAVLNDHDPLYSLVSSAVFWTLFYVLLQNCLIDYCPSLRERCGEGWTKAEMWVCMVHQLGFCGGVLVVFFGLYWNEGWNEWLNRGPVYAYSLERQVHISVFGYELKDFSYGCIQWTWLVHHSLVLGGSVFVLCMPAGAGLSSVNAILAEFGSAAYNMQLLCGGRGLLSMYWIGMSLSNTVVLFGTVMVCLLDMPLEWKLCYGCIGGLLYMFRTEGLRRSMVMQLCGPSTSATDLDSKHESSRSTEKYSLAL